MLEALNKLLPRVSKRPLTQILESIEELRSMHHRALSPKGVDLFCQAFGVKVPPMQELVDRRSEFKGLDLGPDHKEGDVVKGYGATEFAEYVCMEFKLELSRLMGRGFRMDHACDQLKDYFVGLDKKKPKRRRRGQEKGKSAK